MTATITNATATLATILEMHRAGTLMDGKVFSHLSVNLPLGQRSAVYRRLSKKGLLVKHPENDRHEGATVWQLTPLALELRPGEEFSAVS